MLFPTEGKFFVVDPTFLAAATVRPYVRTRGDPLYRPLPIYTLDPTASRFDGAIATVNVPYQPLEPGPQGRLLQVLDREALDWCEDEDGLVGNHPVKLDDPRILILMAGPVSYRPAVPPADGLCGLTSIYAYFGERSAVIPLGGSHPGPARRNLSFAFVRTPSMTRMPSMTLAPASSISATSMPRRLRVPTCRTAECLPACRTISSHTVTHAMLDGMRGRGRLRLATNPDVLAFHEGFADLVAIFMHFSYRDVVRAAIERSPGMPVRDGLLLSVAKQFGQTMTRTDQSGPLRTAIDDAGIRNANSEAQPKMYAEAGQEPHALGSVLVSAVFEAFTVVFQRKTRAYYRLAGPVSPDSVPPGACGDPSQRGK